jgi:8-oxo-dGTP pyrophosphatase MutT (NUDIX family)
VKRSAKAISHGRRERANDLRDATPFLRGSPESGRSPILGSEAARRDTRRQSGALAFRFAENRGIAVLLVRKHTSNKWGIPKGNVERHLTLAENAVKEAFEEAGVTGEIDPHSAGTYRAVKHKRGLKIVIDVSVYLLEVTDTAKEWPEKAEREIKWCSPQEAAMLLHEPLLTELCLRLIQRP